MDNTITSLVDTGANDSVTLEFISFFTKQLRKNAHYKKNYHLWVGDFKKIHGELKTQRQEDLRKIEARYKTKFKDEKDLFIFIYSLESYFVLLLLLISYKSLNGQNLNKIKKDPDLISYIKKKNVLNYFVPRYFELVSNNSDLEHILGKLVNKIIDINISKTDKDFIKHIFEMLFPREIRHSMGEFYTPDWLADFIVKKITEGDNVRDKTYFDPTCGSGTFLFSVIRNFFKKDKGVIYNVFGLDINPLATLAAKTNFILTLNRLGIQKKHIVIPFFNSDCINLNLYDTRVMSEENSFKEIVGNEVLKIAKRDYLYRDYIDLVTAMRTRETCKNKKIEPLILQLKRFNDYDKECALEKLSKYFLPRFNYVLGNPPWVNWEYLPKEYKSKTAHVWQHYNLFDYKGMDSIFVKEDISSLLTYVAVDKYLKNKGKIGFVLKGSLFKSLKQAAGFRSFSILPEKIDFKPYVVYDLTNFKPFPNLNNKTNILFALKGKKVGYPVDYVVWNLNRKKSPNSHTSLEEVLNNSKFESLHAKPINNQDEKSGWITLDKKVIKLMQNFIGKSEYRARTGVFTGGANGIYWLDIVSNKGKTVRVRNIVSRSRKRFRQADKWIEKKFVYPLINGSELDMWSYRYSKYILLPHTNKTKMYPLKQNILLKKYSKTASYLSSFKTELSIRKGFTAFDKKIHEDHYYTLQRIGAYTFTKYKVAWRYISSRFISAVIKEVNDKHLGRKTLIPNEKIIYIGLDNQEEAYYVCGVLSSSRIITLIENFTINTQLSPGILNNISIKEFDKKNKLHINISRLCLKGHNDTKNIQKYIKEIDKLIDKLYLNN